MPTSLTKLLDQAEQHARTIMLNTSTELLPTFHLRSATNQSYLVGTPFIGDTPEEVNLHKDIAAHFIRQIIKEKNITHYSFLSEAWMITRPKWLPGISQPPSQADDRIEIVIAIATDGTTQVSRRWRIKRSGLTCIDLVQDEPSQAKLGSANNSGRFDNLFKDLI